MRNGMVEPERPQLATEYGGKKMRVACRVTKTRVETHAVIIFNMYYYSAATMVTRTRFILALYVYRLSCFLSLLPSLCRLLCI